MINKPVDGICDRKPINSHRFCGDVDRLRKEELKRRRLLRLEQVRQQSKDIASDIRRKVRVDNNAFEDEIRKRNQISASCWKEQKLAALQNELTETLSNVGSGHKHAESEDRQQEARQHLRFLQVEAADQRGREAILHLRLDETARKRAEEAKKLQQQHIHLMEEVRSAVLVSLPLPESTVPPQNPVPVPKTAAGTSKMAKCGSEHNAKQWPSKAWPLSVPLGVTPSTVSCLPTKIRHITPGCVVQSDSCGKDSSIRRKGEAPVTDGFVPPASTKNDLLIYPSADSNGRPCSSKSSGFGAKETSSVATTSTISKQSRGIQAVQLYNYSNGSHVQYIKPRVLAESVPAGPVDGAEAAEACAVDVRDKSSQSGEILAKRLGRGKVALSRVEARREHRELLSDLAGLARQQASLRSFLPSQVEPPKLQVKLNEAVMMDLLRPSSSTVVLDGPSAASETVQSAIPPPRSKETRGDELEVIAESSSKLNLAVWTSRSCADLSEKTLTPSGDETSAEQSTIATLDGGRSDSVTEPNRVEGTGDYFGASRLGNFSEAKVPQSWQGVATQASPKRGEKVPPQKDSPSWSESTSYMSLPKKFLSALTEDIRSLLNLTLRRKATDARWQHNPLLAHFINRLLDMSPESVEELNVIASQVSTPPSTIFRPNWSKDVSDKLSSDVNGQSPVSTKISHSGSYIENEALVSVMRQCHARITSLSQMIEDVRREDFTSTPLHLDSTAYYSPPPNGISPQMVPQTTANNILDETYSGVVSRLISEIRRQLVKEAEKTVKIHVDEPGACSDKLDSSSANDLWTIPELDSSLLDWPSVRLRSDSSGSGSGSGSADDVEKEFRRMGLGWAGATLRKTKESRTLDSNSSSDILELSALFYGSYSHSTPIKTFDDKISLSLGS